MSNQNSKQRDAGTSEFSTPSTFDPNNLDFKKSASQIHSNSAAPTQERISISVTGFYQDPGQPLYVYGRNILNDEVVRVRFNNVEEGANDTAKISRISYADAQAKVLQQYETSSSPRQTMEYRRQQKCKFLSFDKAVLEDTQTHGIKSFRAHWAEGMSNDAKSEVIHGIASLRISKPDGQGRKASGYVEILEAQQTLNINTPDLTKKALLDGLNHLDSESAERRSLLIFKVNYQGNPIVESRIFSSLQPASRSDENGNNVNFKVAAPASTTLAKLLHSQDDATRKYVEDKVESVPAWYADINRVIIHALTGAKLEKLVTQEPEQIEQLRNLKKGIRTGELEVSLITARNIVIGNDALQGMIKRINKPSPLTHYSIKQSTDTGTQQTVPGYLPSSIAIQRHAESKNPFVVFITPSSIVSKSVTLQDLPTESINLAYLTKKFEQFDPAPMPQVKRENNQENTSKQTIDNGLTLNW